MRKVRAVLVSAIMVLGVSLTIGATPAHAAKLVGVFRDYSECQRIGSQGVTKGWWEDYSCEWESRYRYYFLYT
ncbi:hypothetical protein ETD86_19125 [Nonomuraea turkmeniaca]|uniref:Uncharacterized protein n=1 Tax=Nonomuraea turkmeniaca TaxID=103838 RepID=A0A5S4FIT1_9ACTN|nr:hypothetical protein [Nonomuraea turkmeniaca]TMR20185.1 hypothetical protein ETD86_19125 [Nonomuraea turkmeniaca]